MLEEIATEYAGKIDIVKLNVDENPQVAQHLRDHEHPDAERVQGGQVVKEIVGAKPKSALLRELETSSDLSYGGRPGSRRRARAAAGGVARALC